MQNAFYRDGKLVNETIEAEWFLRFFSQNVVGRKLSFLAKSHLISNLYSFYMNSRLSKHKIKSFVKKYDINMKDFVVPRGGFTSFNDFFIRKLKPGVRPIDLDQSVLVAPADSKLYVISTITDQTRFFVKSEKFCLKTFLGDEQLAKEFENGTLLLFRLAPYDYHRYHFPCDCVPSRHKSISGALESVHPIVYEAGSLPLQTNERHVVLLKTEQFDTVAMVVVGAQMVGQITHSFTPNRSCRKGQEAGYFSFGGSSLVLLFKKGVLAPDEKFVVHSQENFETEVKMGQRVGEKL